MSRDELRLILGIAVAMAKNSMTGGQETLSHPLNPSRKSAQLSDSNGYTSKQSLHYNNPSTLFRQKKAVMAGMLDPLVFFFFEPILLPIKLCVRGETGSSGRNQSVP